MPDRRQGTAPELVVDGRRETDPSLTTADCAKTLGVSTQFIIGEILDGRLSALVYRRPGLRRVYRVSPAALRAYRRLYIARSRPPASNAPDSAA